MPFIRNYIDGNYKITQYDGGGSIRDIRTGNIVSDYVSYWTGNSDIHKETKKQIEIIEKKFNIKIKPWK